MAVNVTFYRGGVVATAIPAGQATPDALIVKDGSIAWIGNSSDPGLPEEITGLIQEAETVELDGNLITPAFHDAKIDALTLGLQLLDLPTDPEQALADGELQAGLRAGLNAAAEAGVAVLNHHGNAQRPVSELQKFADLTADAASGLPQVVVYGGGKLTSAAQGQEILAAAPGLAGFGPVAIDGDFTTGTAALEQRYSDRHAPQWSGDDPGMGELLVSESEIAAHLIAATQLGRAAVFRARGDRALHALVAAFEAAAREVGDDALRRAGHQVESADLIDATALSSLVLFGVTIIADPQAEAAFGGEDGLYAKRLGPVRALAMNPWADLITTGVELRFASHAPQRSFNPWGTVHTAMTHHDSGQRLNMIDAFGAHTGGIISLEVGAPATIAIWSAVDTTAYPLRANRGFGQFETVLTLPANSALANIEMDVQPIQCIQVLREGVALMSRHADS